MSELKTYIAYEADDFPDETEFYLKSEADKYIEELKHQRDGAFGLANSGLTLDDLSQLARKEIAHHKYKRCLAMAKTCIWMMTFNSKYGTDKKWHLFKKWHKRWLELAEKFKEAK